MEVLRKIKAFLKNKWFKFTLYGVLWLLFSIWNASFLLLIGIPIIYDIYISKKVHWAFWKKRGVKKQPKVIEWIDSVIYAVVVASFIKSFFFGAYAIPTPSMEKSMLVGDYLFASKFTYGPKRPSLPLSLPFVHHTIPGTNTKSYLDWLQFPFKRLPGLRGVEKGDVVVFNYPEGDTLSDKFQSNQSYYALVRHFGRERVHADKRAFGNIITRPVDKRELYVKRCVATPGDVLEVRKNQLIVNGERVFQEKEQFNYYIKTNGRPIDKHKLKELGVSYSDIQGNGTIYGMPLTADQLDKVLSFKNVVDHKRSEMPGGVPNMDVFPNDSAYTWSRDNYGPLTIPGKGNTVQLTMQSLPLYKRIISVYEGNKLEVKDSAIYINDQLSTEYTFQMDYFFMMGDNRHNSADSRFWGFVPEDHVVAKASVVWLSLDRELSWLAGKLRISRMFRWID